MYQIRKQKWYNRKKIKDDGWLQTGQERPWKCVFKLRPNFEDGAGIQKVEENGLHKETHTRHQDEVVDTFEQLKSNHSGQVLIIKQTKAWDNIGELDWESDQMVLHHWKLLCIGV